MAWSLNHHECYRCGEHWTDEWSCQCDDECPYCGAGDSSPIESEDLSGYIEQEAGEHIVYVSPASADDSPDYEEVGRYRSKRIAKGIMTRRMRKEAQKAFG